MNDIGYTAYWIIIGDGYTGSLATWYSATYDTYYPAVKAVWASSSPLLLKESYGEFTLRGI